MADENFEALMQSVAQTEETTETTEMVATEETTAPATETTDNATQLGDAEMAGTETRTNADTTVETTETAPAVNYNEWLKTESNGLFNSTDDFKQSLDKFKDYDAKVARISDLEKNQLPDDSFVKTLATMRAEGASKDQITQFIKMNTEVEDLNAMTPEELKIASLVLIDGYSKESAARKVEREFGLGNYDEGTDEYEDAKEELRISAKQDLAKLEKYKSQITTVENSRESERLSNIALKSAHEQEVKKVIPNLLDRFSGLGTASLSGTVGKEEVVSEMKFDFDDDFKKEIPTILEDYFTNEIEPVTEEKINNAMTYLKGAYLAENWEKISKQIYLTALAVAQEKTDAKYINANGTPRQEIKPQSKEQQVSDAEWKAFEERFVQRS